jgi:hypothetical protein
MQIKNCVVDVGGKNSKNHREHRDHIIHINYSRTAKARAYVNFQTFLSIFSKKVV